MEGQAKDKSSFEEVPVAVDMNVDHLPEPVIEQGNKEWYPTGKVFEGTHYIIVEPVCSGNIQLEYNNDDNKHSNYPTTAQRHLVVCVHGIGSYHACFNDMAKSLAEAGYRVLQYDLIGRGHSSPDPTGRYDADSHLQQLHSLLVHIQGSPADNQNRRCHIIGHSMGGSLVTLFASRHPEFVQSLTLLSPAGLMGFMPVGFIQSCSCTNGLVRRHVMAVEQAEKIWRAEFFQKTASSLEKEEFTVKALKNQIRYNPESLNALYHCILRFPMSDISKDIKAVANHENIAILVLWGDKDQSVPFGNMRKWENILRKGKAKFVTKTWKKAGHMFFAEFHDEVMEELLGFLSKHDI